MEKARSQFAERLNGARLSHRSSCAAGGQAMYKPRRNLGA